MPRTPLVPDEISLDTYSARILGAEILGRTLAHMTVDDPIDADWWPRNLAQTLGYTIVCQAIAQDAYDELLGA